MKPTFNTIPAGLLRAALLLAAAAVSARADYSSTMLSHGPVAYWHFDETAPSPPLYSITNSSAAGAALTGYGVGTVTNGDIGIVGKCAKFTNPSVNDAANGPATCLSKIDVPYNDLNNPNPPFSVEFWANPDSLGQDSTGTTGYCPLESFDPNFSGGSRAGWLFYLNTTGAWQFRLGNRGGYAGVITAGSGAAVPGTWQHIVATWDGTNAFLYVNGVQVGSGAASAANWVRNPQSFLRMGGTPLNGGGSLATISPISASTTAGNRGFSGYLDEVAIYPKILSASTIAAHHAAASTNNAGYHAQILADSPNAYYELEEPQVTPPSPSTFPVAVNSGSLGSSANGTNQWGALANQPGPGYAGFGASDRAVFFDGDNGYCQIADAPGLHFTNTITMAAWVKPTEKDFFREIITHGFDTNGAETFLRISRGIGSDFTGDGNYYEVGSTDGGVLTSTYYDSVLFPMPPGDIGNWVFLVGTFDGAHWNLYRNGQLLGSIAASPTDPGAYDVSGPWTIASRQLNEMVTNSLGIPFIGQQTAFGGTIDEPAILTNALSAADINALYNAAQVPPVFTGPVQNPGTVFKGSTVAFSVWAEGSPTLSYMWTSNGIATGDTATNYTISNIPVGSFTIAVTVTNPYGTNTSSVSFVSVNQPPSITAPPVSTVRYAGYPFNFSVGAIGTAPITYYWNQGSTLVQSGTSSNYSAVASAGTAGTYTVVLSNQTGITVTSAPVVLTVLPNPAGSSYAGTVLGNSPIAYWRLDETNGTAAHDSVGGNDGVFNSAILGVPGYSAIDPTATAVQFSGLNSYVGNISGTAINFTGHTNFTLEAWVNAPSGQSDQATIIAKGIGNNGTTETEQFAVDVSSGFYRFFVSRGTTVNQISASDGPNGTWQHVVAVYDDSNSLGGGTNMYIFVNGTQEASGATLGGTGLNATATPVSIGSKRTGNDPNYDGTFNGAVDQVAVYNHALSAATVQAHYSAAYGPNTAPFITVPPSGVTNYASLSVTLEVAAAGTQPLQYTWNRNGVALTDGGTAYGSTIAGSSTAKVTISGLALLDAGSYSVSITNGVNPGLTSVSVPLVVLLPPTNPPAIAGLVAHLTFNNTLTDATGRGNNAISIHATTNATGGGYSSNVVAATFTDGHLGTNFAFHYSTTATNTGGTVSVGTDDFYASLGVRPDLQFSSNVNFTVAYWIRLPQGFQGGDLPFFTDAIGSEGNVGFVFAPAYGYGTASPTPTPDPTSWLGCWAFTVYGPTAGIRIYGSNLGAHPGAVADGFYHHLVHVFDRSANGVITYLDGEPNNGVLQAGTTLGSAGDIDSGHAATIGQDPTGLYGEQGSGDIDDLGVWRKALTPLEVASIYTAAISNHLSFTSGTFAPLTFKRSGNQLTLSWTSGFWLTTATNLNGPWTDVTTDSPLTVTPTGPQKLYRVRF